MLTRMSDGKVYLEDPDDQIELVFSEEVILSIHHLSSTDNHFR